jgi:hypothetical protein
VIAVLSDKRLQRNCLAQWRSSERLEFDHFIPLVASSHPTDKDNTIQEESRCPAFLDEELRFRGIGRYLQPLESCTCTRYRSCDKATEGKCDHRASTTQAVSTDQVSGVSITCRGSFCKSSSLTRCNCLHRCIACRFGCVHWNRSCRSGSRYQRVRTLDRILLYIRNTYTGA